MKIFKKLKRSISGQKDRAVDSKQKTNGSTAAISYYGTSVQDYATIKDLKAALRGKKKYLGKSKSAGPTSPTSTSSSDTSDTAGSDSETTSASTSTCASSSSSGGNVNVNVNPCSNNSEHNKGDLELMWKLSDLDVATSEPQTMEQELARLTALQSYFILDADTSSEFDRLTAMACKVFDVPMAYISMIDLGRQWLLTATGIPNANGMETTRQAAFCSHTIQSKLPCLVVPDLTQDVRFRDSPFVTDPHGLQLRFYAGCPLIVPEGGGAKVGTFCIIDTKVRTSTTTTTPFTESDQHILQDMAALAVNALVARRHRLLKQEQDSKMLELAESYAEMHSCLCKAQSCLQVTANNNNNNNNSKRSRNSNISSTSTIQEEDDENEDEEEDDDATSMESLFDLADELQLQTEISAANARTIVMEHQQQQQQQQSLFHFDNLQTVAQQIQQEERRDDERALEKANQKRIPPAYVRLLQNFGGGTTAGGGDDYSSAGSRSTLKTNKSTTTSGHNGGGGGGGGIVNMIDMYQNINHICARFTRPVPIYVELQGNVPAQIQCRGSDLLVFKATMSLLANANARIHKWATNGDDDGGMIHLRIQTQHSNTTLLVECQDTGCFAAEWEGSMEFDDPQSPLYPIRKISRALGGACGMRLGCFAEETHGVGHDEKAGPLRAAAAKTGMELLDDVEHEQEYCIFWWSMPLMILPHDNTSDDDGDDECLDSSADDEDHRETLIKVHEQNSSADQT